jgi:hypothetical protein
MQYSPGICFEGLHKTTENVEQPVFLPRSEPDID